MANPQPTDAHLRISHAITRELIRRNFSKPHKNILEFILRLSWGCGSPSACIPERKDFTICGVAAGHVANEIRQLVEAKVLIVEEPFYQIQKDFDQWQVTPVKGWDSAKYDELVSKNIKLNNPDLRESIPNGGSQSPYTGENPVQLEGGSYRKTGAESTENPCRIRLREGSIIKVLYSNKNRLLLRQQKARVREENPFVVFEQEFGRNLSSFEIDQINDWIDNDGFSQPLIIRGLKEAVLAQKLGFKYIDRCLRDWKMKGWHTPEQVDAGKRGQSQQPQAAHSGTGQKVVPITTSYNQQFKSKFQEAKERHGYGGM